MSVLCRFSKFAKVSYKRKRSVRVIFILRENMVHQYFSKRERQHISDLQKQHSGVNNSKENMKSVEFPLSVPMQKINRHPCFYPVFDRKETIRLLMRARVERFMLLFDEEVSKRACPPAGQCP